MERILNLEMLKTFEETMRADEKSPATIRQYLRDAETFIRTAGEGTVLTKDVVIAYKEQLAQRYQITSANVKIAAINSFLRSAGAPDCVVRAYRVQPEAFRSRGLHLEEYLRLLDAAREQNRRRLYLVIQTIACTGIRVSELPFITVKAAHCRRAQVSLKGKTRVVLLPQGLCEELRDYARERGITSGSIFITRSGRNMDRTNILHEMKSLCEAAGVAREKLFPHNLRHLFAVMFYSVDRDVCRLADLLGHSSINTTRIYTRVSCEIQEEWIERLGLVARWLDMKNTA